METGTTSDEPDRQGILSALEELVGQDGFIYTFCFLVFESLWISPDELADVDWYERPNAEELSFLLGLMVKRPIQLLLPKNAESVQSQREAARRLLNELHQSYSPRFSDSSDFDGGIGDLAANVAQAIQRFRASGDDTVETTFYSGSGAFDFQYLDLAAKRCVRDSAWIEQHLGTSLESVIESSRHIKELFNRRVFDRQPPSTFEEECHSALSILSLSPEDFPAADQASISALLEHFALTPGCVNSGLDSLGAYNQALSHPLIRLAPDRYFLPIHHNLPCSIYESPFYWMLQDPRYTDQGLKNRGDATEELAYDMLSSVFGDQAVLRGVTVCRGGQRVTDIDVLAFAGNKAIVVQAKPKKMTELSRRGDEKSVRRDFREAIQQAYDQGVVSRSALIDGDHTLVDDRGQPVLINQKIDDAYIVCLTGDYYPAVMNQLDIYLQKGPQDPFPIALSIFDLDVVCFYLDDPFDLLYYIRQRSAHSRHFHSVSEMAMLSFHLRHKLHPDEKASGNFIDSGYAQLIDEHYPIATGDYPPSDFPDRLHHQWRNDEFERLVADVKSSPAAERTDALFFLFDLAGSGADELFDIISATKGKTRRDGRIHDASLLMNTGDRGITFVCYPSTATDAWARLQTHAFARKYKSRADEWLGLGSIAGSDRIADIVWYSNESWRRDPELEALLAQGILRPGTYMKGRRRKIGRNERCYCASGLKYKRCHGL